MLCFKSSSGQRDSKDDDDDDDGALLEARCQLLGRRKSARPQMEKTSGSIICGDVGFRGTRLSLTAMGEYAVGYR